MTGVVKWNKSNLRKFEKEVSREMNKRIDKVNKNLKPIRLTAESPNNLGSGVTINTINNANNIKITGNVHDSRIGSIENYQHLSDYKDIEGILREIREISKTMKDRSDLDELAAVINRLERDGNIGDNHKSFLEKHPLIAMGIGAVISWTAQNGIENLSPIMQAVFRVSTS